MTGVFLGYRGMHLLLGLVTIVMVYAMTRQWYGTVPARWAAAFMAFNEYYLNVSSRATAHVPNLLFVTAAVYAFSRFLASERPRYLYLAGASMGLAFYCKESTAPLPADEQCECKNRQQQRRAFLAVEGQAH